MEAYGAIENLPERQAHPHDETTQSQRHQRRSGRLEKAGVFVVLGSAACVVAYSLHSSVRTPVDVYTRLAEHGGGQNGAISQSSLTITDRGVRDDDNGELTAHASSLAGGDDMEGMATSTNSLSAGEKFLNENSIQVGLTARTHKDARAKGYA